MHAYLPWISRTYCHSKTLYAAVPSFNEFIRVIQILKHTVVHVPERIRISAIKFQFSYCFSKIINYRLKPWQSNATISSWPAKVRGFKVVQNEKGTLNCKGSSSQPCSRRYNELSLQGVVSHKMSRNELSRNELSATTCHSTSWSQRVVVYPPRS